MRPNPLSHSSRHRRDLALLAVGALGVAALTGFLLSSDAMESVGSARIAATAVGVMGLVALLAIDLLCRLRRLETHQLGALAERDAREADLRVRIDSVAGRSAAETELAAIRATLTQALESAEQQLGEAREREAMAIADRDAHAADLVATRAILGETREREAKASAALATTAANLRALSDHAHIGITVLRNGRYAYANRHVTQRLGYSIEELNEIDVSQVIHPDARDAVLDRYRRRLAGEDVPSRYETKLITKDGRTLTVEVSAAVTSWDGQTADIVFTTDITARKAAEAELATMRAQLADAIESIEHGIALWDSDDRLTLFNQHFSELFADHEGLIRKGLPFEDFARAVLGRDLVAGVPEREIEATLGERVARHRRADGTPMLRKFADGRVLRVSERQARGGGIVGIATDVTEQLRTEHQLREAVKMEAIGKLTGGMAHDFNNYLAVIMGNLELLTEYGAGDPDAAAWIGETRTASQRAAELTRSLLAFARRQPLDPKPTELNRRISELADLLRRTLGEDVVLTTSLAPDLRSVTIDGAQFDACIVSLANNARDAMPRGGHLEIATRNIHLDERYAIANPDAGVGDYALIEVSDSGTGMPPEVAANAFEPFFTTKKAGHGTGLGLSMVYGFVKQSGGHVKIDSAVGRGTVVRLYLPRGHGVPAAIAPAAVASGPAPRGMESVLIVEDNEPLREMATTALSRHGYRVIEAATGAAALAILDRRDVPIDLLLSDIVMPGEPDGHELARLALERRPGIRILLTSGFPGGRFHDHGRDSAPANLLAKPYRVIELLQAVRATLDHRDAAGAALPSANDP